MKTLFRIILLLLSINSFGQRYTIIKQNNQLIKKMNPKYEYFNQPITLQDLNDYKEYCYNDSSFVGWKVTEYELITESGSSCYMYYEVYPFIGTKKYDPQSPFNKYVSYYEEKPFIRYEPNHDYVRIEDVYEHKQPTLEGFIEWINKKTTVKDTLSKICN